MRKTLILTIILLVIFSCKTEPKKGVSTNSTNKVQTAQINNPIINSELIDDFYSNKYLDSLALVEEFATLEEISVNENSDTIKILFKQIPNWNDPGDFLKIQIKNSKNIIIFEQVNFEGWMKCRNSYKLPKSVESLNQLKSEKAFLINSGTGKQLVLFGYTYASQPGLMTIIDLFPKPQIIFNKQFELSSISEPNNKGYRNYIGSTTLSDEVTLNMEIMKIE